LLNIIEFFKGIMGGKVSESQLEQFHVGESVFMDLAQRKILGQVARREGFYPSADQIREQILKQDVFKKDGHFDKMLYRNLLQANSFTPVRYEELVGQDIMDQSFKAFLGSLVRVMPDEIEKELKSSKEKHKFKYVYLDHESARKLLPSGLKPADQGKALNDKIDELEKQILPLLTGGSDAKINAALKSAKLTVKTSDWVSSQSNIIPGVGSIRSVQDTLFALKKGDAAQKFNLMGGTLFAVSAGNESFDPKSVTDQDRKTAYTKILNEKQGEFMKQFMNGCMKEARVTRNDQVVTGGKGGAMPVNFDN
ncbi:MAG: hypothetical protein EBX52_08170, partial [Proteobacteria bacterium]|nr:hypothetical protein [Pseudomonadota bacterium]